MLKNIVIFICFIVCPFSEIQAEEPFEDLIPIFKAKGFLVQIDPGTLYTSYADEKKNKLLMNQKINPSTVLIFKAEKNSERSFKGYISGGNVSPLTIIEFEGATGQTRLGKFIRTLDRLLIIEEFSVGQAIYHIYNSKIDGANAYHVTITRMSYHNDESFQTIASGRAYPIENLEDYESIENLYKELNKIEK